MNDIGTYDLISVSSRDDLVDRVNDAIQRGWLPHGGVTVVRDQYTPTLFAQAMTHTARLTGQHARAWLAT